MRKKKSDVDINEEELYQFNLGSGSALCVDRDFYFLGIRNFSQISLMKVVSSEDMEREVRQIQRNYKLLWLVRNITPKSWSVWLRGFGMMRLHKTSIKQEQVRFITVYDDRCPDKCDTIYSGMGILRAEDAPVLAEFYGWCNRKAKSVMSNFDYYKGKHESREFGYAVGMALGELYVSKKETAETE